MLKNNNENKALLKEKLYTDKRIIECSEFLKLETSIISKEEFNTLDITFNESPSNYIKKDDNIIDLAGIEKKVVTKENEERRISSTTINAVITDQINKLPKTKEEFKKRIPSYSLIAALSGAVIANPLFVGFTAVLVAGEFKVYNKLNIKNGKSTLFGISKKNYITQNALMTSQVIKNAFNDHKTETFSVELVNLLLDLEKNENYETVSQSIIRKGLRDLAKEGYISNYTEELVNLTGIKSKFAHTGINIGMGNYDDLLKESKKYKMAFTRTEKEIDLNVIEKFLNRPGNEINHEINYENDKIDKVVYQGRK